MTPVSRRFRPGFPPAALGRLLAAALGLALLPADAEQEIAPPAAGPLELRLTGDYHAVGMAGMLGGGTTSALGGDLTVAAIIASRRAPDGAERELRLRMRHRHAISEFAPAALRSELGLLWGTVEGFSDRGLEIPDLFFRHLCHYSGVELRLGQMPLDSPFDGNSLRGPKRHFLNQAFNLNPAIPFPRYGAGILLGKNFSQGSDLLLAASNVQGTRIGDQVDSKFDSDAVFSAIQFGHRFRDPAETRIQLMAWHSDAFPSARRPSGQGLALTAERKLDDQRGRVFLRLAIADGGAAVTDRFCSVGWVLPRGEHTRLGLGIGAGRGSGPGRPVQVAAEGFLHWSPNPRFTVSPSLQVLAGEGLRGSPGLRLLPALRIGAAF